jgi:hypothetical protein
MGLGRRHQPERRGVEHVDAGVDGVGGDLRRVRLLDEAEDPAVRVGLDEAVGRGIGDGGEHERRRRARAPVALDDGRQVHVGQHVSVEDDGRVVEPRLRVLDRAAGAERRLLHGVADALAEAGAVAEDGAHPVGLVGDREDDVLHAHLAQQVELVAQEGPVHHRHHRLGQGERERPQPRALASGEDYRAHVPEGGALRSSAAMRMAIMGERS